MDRVDGYLSGKAQAYWPDSLVVEKSVLTRDETGCEVPGKLFVLSRRGQPDVALGVDFRSARSALFAMRAQRKAEIQKEAHDVGVGDGKAGGDVL